MVRGELQQFIRYNQVYRDLCGKLLDKIHFRESTVAAITRCGTKAGTAFLSHNFTRVFGYPRNYFIKGDLQFLIKYIHPDELPAFVYFAETSTLNARPWHETNQDWEHEHYCHVKHFHGKWMWMKQRVIVLSVTPERHIDHALLLFDDCTGEREAELNQLVSIIEKGRKKSKLLGYLATLGKDRQFTKNPEAVTGNHAALTAREKEIMLLVAQGFSSIEIASKLFISKHTVETHRKHILRKLSVRNSSQMVRQSMLSSIK